MRGSDSSAATARAFTLMELLVVMAILGVVLVATTTISREAIEMRGMTKARIVAERNAAAFLRQFGGDVAQRLNRREARLRVDKHAGDDEITFLTRRQGYPFHETAADRRVSLVSYRVTDGMLERAADGFGFGGAQQRPSLAAGTLALAELPAEGPAEPADKLHQVIAPGVIRLEFSFLVRDGARRVVRADPPQDQGLIEAVVATVATIDPDRRRMLDKAKLAQVAAEFPDAVDNEVPGGKWREVAADLVKRLPQLPPTALQQVRVQQGLFPLPNLDSIP